MVIATRSPTDKPTANARIAANVGLVFTHDGNVTQELHQLPTQTPRVEHYQLPQLISRIPEDNPRSLIHVVDIIILLGSRTHATPLLCNRWFSCHVYSSSWHVCIEYSTRTAKQYHSNVTSNSDPQKSVLFQSQAWFCAAFDHLREIGDTLPACTCAQCW